MRITDRRLSRAALAASLSLVLVVQASAGLADDPKPNQIPELMPTSAGAPKMPRATRAARLDVEYFCSVEEKERKIHNRESDKTYFDGKADEARDYVQKMRAHIESERVAGKEAAATIDRKALEAFEDEDLQDMTVTYPHIADTNLENAEKAPVVTCSGGVRVRPPKGTAPPVANGGKGVQPAPGAGDVPEVTGDMQPAKAQPERTPTLSGLHHPPLPMVRKPAPGSTGYNPPVIPPPRPGATPTPPGTKNRLPPDKLPPNALHPLNPPN